MIKNTYTSNKPINLWSHEGYIPFKLDVLTPVFIGSGEAITPLEYVIRKEKNGFAIHLIDTEDWLCHARPKDAVEAALNSGDLPRLRSLMHEHVDEKVYSLARIPVSNSYLASILLKYINNPVGKSKVEIELFFRNPLTKNPILPGSSLKGALSTPIIDFLDKEGMDPGVGRLKTAVERYKQERAYKHVLEEIFGKISDHAMSALKVSDISVPQGQTQLVAAQEVRKKEHGKVTPKVPCEVLLPSNMGGIPLYGRLFLKTMNGIPCITLPDKTSFGIDDIIRITGKFYKERYKKEYFNFYTYPHLKYVSDELTNVTDRIDSLLDDEILLRVGRYSHIECMTVKNNAPSNRKVFGKTRTLADGHLPFGWVILKLCSEKEYIDGMKNLEEHMQQNIRL